MHICLVWGLKKVKSESRLYIRKVNSDILIVSLYIDDLLVTGSNQCLMVKFKAEMEEVFEMTDLGDMSYFLRMEVHQNQHEIFICQQKYAKETQKVQDGGMQAHSNTYESKRKVL